MSVSNEINRVESEVVAALRRCVTIQHCCWPADALCGQAGSASLAAAAS